MSYQRIRPSLRQMYPFIKKASFKGGEMSPPCLNPKLKDYSLSAVCDCLCNIFIAIFHIGCCSSNRNLRTGHALVTGTHLFYQRHLQIAKGLSPSGLQNIIIWTFAPLCLSSYNILQNAIHFKSNLL